MSTVPTNPQIAITAEPISAVECRFTIDRPVYQDRSFYFGSKERAAGSPLAERLLAIEGVTAVLISHDQVTVSQTGRHDWRVIGKEIGAAIRAHIGSGQPAVDEAMRNRIAPPEEIRARVQDVLDTEINPAVASHGGYVTLIDVRDNVVYVQMGGGCQGCGMANVTLKQGVEKAIRFAVPDVGEILDVTDHAAGRNPYYTPAKGGAW